LSELSSPTAETVAIAHKSKGSEVPAGLAGGDARWKMDEKPHSGTGIFHAEGSFVPFIAFCLNCISPA